MDITNKTAKPLSLTLPGGKKLFLGPGKTGQVTARSLEHPSIAKLIEAGDLETSDKDGVKPISGGGGKSGSPAAGSGRAGSGPKRQSGDR